MHKVKRIAVICNYQLKANRIGSMDRFFLAFDEACKKRGYTVDWFFPKSEQLEIYNSVSVYSDDKSNIESLFLNHIYSNKVEYDYVFTHFIELFTSFYKTVKNELNCKVFAVDHMSRPLEGFPLKKRIKRKLKYLINNKSIEKIIAVSEYIKNQNLKDYSSNLENRTDVIYNGIQTELYQVREKGNRDNLVSYRFIVVSHLVYEKGIQDLILALTKLDKTTLENITIDVFGEGIYKSTLTDLVHKYNLESTINFKGSVDNLYALYKVYDYMIQPTYMEAFSLSILESLCCNVPVITTTVGGNVEIVKDGTNGYLFKAKDVNALQSIITQICNDKISLLNNSFSSKIREQYALKTMVDNYLKLV